MAEDNRTLETQGRYAFGLSPGEVERFRDIMKRDCGIDLSLEEAWPRAIELLALGKLLVDSDLPQRGAQAT